MEYAAIAADLLHPRRLVAGPDDAEPRLLLLLLLESGIKIEARRQRAVNEETAMAIVGARR